MNRPLSQVALSVREFFRNLRPAPDSVGMSSALLEARQAEDARQKSRIDNADMQAQIRDLSEALTGATNQDQFYRNDYFARAAELVEARQMGGSGPWLVAEARQLLKARPDADGAAILKESNPLLSRGAFGDIEFALQNIEWRREINQSWLEFSRWGIQQVMLIARLYYIKNPICRRLIDIAACYVFGRGVELSSPDEDANSVLKDFLRRNKQTLGQIALAGHERSKFTDGNLFFVFFPDSENTGEVNIRTIDATEIMDIVTDPDDADTPWYYRRCWTQRQFDPNTGTMAQASAERWYPALRFNPTVKPQAINGIPVMWNNPIHHRRCGAIAKWNFGCPLIYPALDWARESRKYLEACASVMQALNQIALKFQTKGGQAAIAGIKQQMGTTVGVNTSAWDMNPRLWRLELCWNAGHYCRSDEDRRCGARSRARAAVQADVLHGGGCSRDFLF